MKKFLFLAFILSTVSCRKDLSGTDYGELIGKYKLVYSLKYTASATERINPSDNYEIDFNRNGKVYTYKNGHCDSKDKVEDCFAVVDNPSQYKNIFLHLKKPSVTIEMGFPYYSTGYDTLIIGGYYPFQNDPNNTPNTYGHRYVKE
jgi:hypothetical protein